MTSKRIKVDFPLVKVVADGSIMSCEFGEGRMIPALIIDIEEHIEISEYIKLHHDVEIADVDTTWSLPDSFFKPKFVVLKVCASEPLKIKFGIIFDLTNQYSLIDGILNSNALYLQPGKHYNKVSELNKDNILIEVPTTDFKTKWEPLLMNTIKQNLKKKGFNRKDIKPLALDHIKQMRQLFKLKIKS